MGKAAVITLILAAVLAGALGVANGAARQRSGNELECPGAAELIHPTNPRGAVPTAKAYSFGSRGRVIAVRRAVGSTYAASARRMCGPAVLTDSVYVQVHPVGVRCSACDAHLYMAKGRGAPWRVWASY